jgi:hypothetical protein
MEDEAEIIRGLQSRLLEHNIVSRSFSSRDIEEFSSQNCFLHNASGKMKILIVRLLDSERSSAKNEDLLQNLEEASNLNSESLLGKVTIWAGYNEDYAKLKTVLGINRREAMQFKINGGSLYRLSFYWPRGHARYICVMSEKNAVNEMFLAGGLPLIEAGLLQLHLIVNLYKDRNSAIDKQSRELEMKLSVILHTDLVSKQGQSKLVDDLEDQLNELAKSYGITAGNKNVIQEGINLIKLQLEGVTRRIRMEKALLMSREEIDRMVEPFKLRLNQMVSTSSNLEISLKSHQAAINVVESKVDIMNSRQNIATQEKIKDLLELNSRMQKQSLIFQISAAAIEFIVIAYYSHSLWKNLSPGAYHAIPGWLQLIFVLLFSGNIVYCTHLIGEYIQDKKDEHVKKHLLISLIPLSVLLLVILVSSFLFGN